MHNHKQTDDRKPYNQPGDRLGEQDFAPFPAVMSFDQNRATCQPSEASSVRLRVPSVLFFVGEQGRDSDALMQELDNAHQEFATRKVQLVVVIGERPSRASSRLKLSVPIMEDNGLSDLFLGKPLQRISCAAAILANDGRALGVLQTFPATRPASPILGRIDRLRVRLPNLFSSGHSTRARFS